MKSKLSKSVALSILLLATLIFVYIRSGTECRQKIFIFVNTQYAFDQCYGPNLSGHSLSLLAELKRGPGQAFAVKPLKGFFAAQDPKRMILEIFIFSDIVTDKGSTDSDRSSFSKIPFSRADGLSEAPAPFAPGYYVGDPRVRTEPGGDPILFGCTNLDPGAAGHPYNECQTAYRLNNGDTLSYSIAGIEGKRPNEWASIDVAVRDFVENARRKGTR